VWVGWQKNLCRRFAGKTRLKRAWFLLRFGCPSLSLWFEWRQAHALEGWWVGTVAIARIQYPNWSPPSNLWIGNVSLSSKCLYNLLTQILKLSTLQQSKWRCHWRNLPFRGGGFIIRVHSISSNHRKSPVFQRSK
jgi:hypothetical protein